MKIATVEKAHEMIEPGTEIGETEVVEVTEKIEECRGVMLGATTTTAHRGGIEIFSRVAWTEVQVPAAVGDLQEAIEMSLPCRWEAEIGRRAPVLHQRRRSLHLI